MRILFAWFFPVVACFLGLVAIASGVELDDETLRIAGIRKIQSQHLTLYTDLASSPDVDELPKVFDLAVPQWAQFFNVDLKRLSTWHVEACLMKNSQRFTTYRLLPDDLPEFNHGIQRVDQLWLHEQPSVYYRRHLLLHEGTHSVMNRIFGRVGPVWYREGIAEMLGTHRFQAGKLSLNVVPKNRDQAEYWGRIKVIRDDTKENGIRQISQIVATPTRAFVNNDAYAWSWALQYFLYGRPEYADLRDSLLDEMYHSERRVTKAFLRRCQLQREELDYDWNLFVQHLDYGYDSSKEGITFAPSKRPLPSDIVTIRIETNKGWQSTGLIIPPNTSLDIGARGKYELAKPAVSAPPGKHRVTESSDGVWVCEPQGVTIEYYQGRPLGQLLGAIVPENASSRDTLFRSESIGRRAQLSTKTGGQLFLRVNERTDRMGDNRGQITVRIRRALNQKVSQKASSAAATGESSDSAL